MPIKLSSPASGTANFTLTAPTGLSVDQTLTLPNNTGTLALLTSYDDGQLQYVSTTQIKFMPRTGNILVVNGVPCTIPDAGVTLSNAGLSASTKYYIYATQSAGVVNALEASTTTHVTSTTAGNKGVEIKSGDDSRSLVGMIATNAASQFEDNTLNRLVRSWFNDAGTCGYASYGSNVSNPGAPWVEISAIRGMALMWNGECLRQTSRVSFYDTVAPTYVYVDCGVNQSISGTGGYAMSPSTGNVAHVSAGTGWQTNSDAVNNINIFTGQSTGSNTVLVGGYIGYEWVVTRAKG